MNNKFKIFSKGIVDVSPLMIPVVPFGIIFGVLAIDMGLTPYATMAMSIIIFGGASQIIFLQLFSGGASSLVILSSVGAVNSRHLLYGAVLSEHLSALRLTWKIIVSYFLVDQAFIISNNYLKKSKDENKHFHLLGSGFTCWFIWQTTTFLGIILGSIILAKLGLTFAIPLTFLALLVNDFRKLCAIESYSVTDNISELTARINDEGWDSSFLEWLKASNFRNKDGLFVLSVGGGDEAKKVSVNIVNAIKYVEAINSNIFGIVGRDGGYAKKNNNNVILIPNIEDLLVTPLSESFQSVIWHCLVSNPVLQVAKTKW